MYSNVTLNSVFSNLYCLNSFVSLNPVGSLVTISGPCPSRWQQSKMFWKQVWTVSLFMVIAPWVKGLIFYYSFLPILSIVFDVPIVCLLVSNSVTHGSPFLHDPKTT